MLEGNQCWTSNQEDPVSFPIYSPIYSFWDSEQVTSPSWVSFAIREMRAFFHCHLIKFSVCSHDLRSIPHFAHAVNTHYNVLGLPPPSLPQRFILHSASKLILLGFTSDHAFKSVALITKQSADFLERHFWPFVIQTQSVFLAWFCSMPALPSPNPQTAYVPITLIPQKTCSSLVSALLYIFTLVSH